ncbi:hypothetical protein [Candidatus Palauibacter sp.]|uniref:hypothetical protein n=1 Tax=Candidatus Palauibacter sp. TaxID=3101350 RepID=UPI003CC5358E
MTETKTKSYFETWFDGSSDRLKDGPRKREIGIYDPEDAQNDPRIPPRHRAKWRRDGTCSYCGSMKPSIFFAAIEAGALFTGSDKNYKACLQTDADYKGPKLVAAKKLYLQHFDSEDRRRFIELTNTGRFHREMDGWQVGLYVTPFFTSRKEES